MFIIETTVAAKSQAEIVRSVCCEQCHVEYVFKVEHTAKSSTSYLYGIGGAEARKRVQRAADKLVLAQIDRVVRPVPCPSCGWYQPEMVNELRSRMPRPLDLGIAFLLAFGGSLLALAAFGAYLIWDKPPKGDDEVFPYVTTAVLGVLGSAVLVLGIAQSRGRRSAINAYSPNEALPTDVRIARGKSKAVVLAEFKELCPGVRVVPFKPVGR